MATSKHVTKARGITLPVVGRRQLLDDVMDTQQPVVLVLHSLLKHSHRPGDPTLDICHFVTGQIHSLLYYY